MDGVRVVFDASPYVLFEAIGDSESQHSGGVEEAENAGGMAEDDAHSCSYESWAYSDGGVRGVGGVAADSEYDCCGAGQEAVLEEEADGGPGGGSSDYEEEEEEEEEDGVVDQILCGGGKAAPPPEGDKLNKSQLVNDEERDRLFWEDCLAS